MPRADITSEYRSDAGRSNFPKLKLQTNEHARVVIVGKPIIEYVHWLEAPNIVNMAPTYKKIKDRDGNDRYVVDTRFVARPICSGAFEVLRERGVDDRNCQACNMARERPDIFRGPSPRYAANILRYNLRPGGGWNEIASPYGVGALIWVFGGKVMDKLIDIRSMGPAYEDIRGVDLLLTCDDQNFQKPYSNGEFLPVAPAVWMANDQTRQYTVAYLQQNGASDDDLTEAIGRRVKEDWLADDISRVIQRWDVVRAYEARQQGAPQMGAPGFGAETLHQGMAQVQQQYGPPGGAVHPGGGYGGQPGSYAAPAAGAGVDMGLMSGHAAPPAPPPPPPPVPPPPAADYMAAAQQAAMQGQNPAVAAYESATGQQLPPGTGQVGDMFATSVTPPPVTAPPPPPPAPVTEAAGLANVAPPPPPQAPTGMDGLQEFMAQTTSNPSLQAPPAPGVAPGPPSPAAPSQSQPPAGGSYTFEELANLGKQQ